MNSIKQNMVFVSKTIKNHQKSSKYSKSRCGSGKYLKILKSVKKSQIFRLCRLPVKISPSSEGVRSKIRYLRLPTLSQLSRKQVFRAIGDVLRAENSNTQKSSKLGKFRYVLFSAALYVNASKQPFRSLIKN